VTWVGKNPFPDTRIALYEDPIGPYWSILAIDPGDPCGVAALVGPGYDFAGFRDRRIELWQGQPWHLVEMIRDAEGSDGIVAAELPPQPLRVYHSAPWEVFGAARLVSRAMGLRFRPVPVAARAAARKRFRASPGYGQFPHALDALAVLLYVTCRKEEA